MIWPLLVAASVSAAPAAPLPSAHELLVGASHAIRAERLDQAALMVSRALVAGASGLELDRVRANLAYARGNFAEASQRYSALLKVAPTDQSLLEPAAMAALKLGQRERAASLLEIAKSQKGATWRVWDACGVAADLRADWAEADECYDEAFRLAPNEAGPANNRGWSLLLRGDWERALAFFERAVALDPKLERAANNLELTRAALATDLPRRREGESDESWAQRLNDAGVAAEILGDKSRAKAAFTQALTVSGRWYARAAINLESVSRR